MKKDDVRRWMMEEEEKIPEKEQQSLYSPKEIEHLERLRSLIRERGGYGEIRISFFRDQIDATSVTVDMRPGHQF